LLLTVCDTISIGNSSGLWGWLGAEVLAGCDGGNGDVGTSIVSAWAIARRTLKSQKEETNQNGDLQKDIIHLVSRGIKQSMK
jgi:hypothetical protein